MKKDMKEKLDNKTIFMVFIFPYDLLVYCSMV